MYHLRGGAHRGVAAILGYRPIASTQLYTPADHTSSTRSGTLTNMALPSRQVPVRELATSYGKPPNNRDWRKLHVSVTALTGEITECDLTSKSAPDASRVPARLKQIDRPLASAFADAAHDQEAVYEAVENHTATRSPRNAGEPSGGLSLVRNGEIWPGFELCTREARRYPAPNAVTVQRADDDDPMPMRIRASVLVVGGALALGCAEVPTAMHAPIARPLPKAALAAAPAPEPDGANVADAGVVAAQHRDEKARTIEGQSAPAEGGGQVSTSSSCPEGMIRVTHDFCPELERICRREEYERSNHLRICHEFQPGSGRCLSERARLDFCIDAYEFPNQKGAHPPVMVDFHDAKAACAASGKRLCFEREWTAACEGPEETPFPYGWSRSSQRCNIDNRWIEPSLGALYSKHAAIRERELARLDQSVPSGAREGCTSGFGVHDLTGNFDEWTLADRRRPRAKGKDAALKGGAWGHVRNACRPVTTSHAPEFRYYFVSFRCCADVPAGG